MQDRQTTVVLPKNCIRQLYQPTRRTSNWVTAEKMARKKPGIPRESGCLTITSQTGSDEPARQADVYDHAAREYR
jgi:hypothetical protein